MKKGSGMNSVTKYVLGIVALAGAIFFSWYFFSVIVYILVAAVISFIGYFLIAMPVCYICGFVFHLGIQGIWLGYPVGLTLTGIMMCIRYYRKLKRKYI